MPQKKPAAKGGKKKKQVLKFTLDCTHPVEDGIMDAANFVSARPKPCEGPAARPPTRRKRLPGGLHPQETPQGQTGSVRALRGLLFK